MKKKIPIIAFTVLMSFGLLISALISGSGQLSDLRKFSHSYHITEAGLECETCHAGITELNAGKRAMPDHDVCVDCHEVDNDSECGTCHINAVNPEAIPGMSKYYMAFSHKEHVAQNPECITCHGDLNIAGNQPSITDMSGCMTCHENKNAPLNCEECHQGTKPRPSDHLLVSWSQDHGMAASSGTSDCNLCHQQTSCDECHQGVNIFGKPHPPTWKFNHFAESSFGGECLVCHETRESCTSCHRSMLPMPHVLGAVYANRNDGGEHVSEAKAFIEVCVSCHDVGNDATCAKCHD